MHIKTLKIKNNKKIKTKAKYFFVNNKLFTVLFVIFIFGAIVGNLVIKNTNENFLKDVADLLTLNFRVRSEGSFFNIFTESIFSNFIFILIIFSMGLSVFGVTLVPPIVFLKGYFIGIFQNYLCKSFGIKGILFFIFVILPGFIFSILATLLMAKEAIKISNIFSNMLLNIKNWQNDEKSVKSYLQKTCCVLILIVTSAFIDSILNLILFRFFSF